MANDLCTQVGLNATDYIQGRKTFGMDEVKIFADHLAPKYGVAVHNSLTANQKIFESSTGKGKILWINLLNLNEHFSPITLPAGFFGSHYWCEKCNTCYLTKKNTTVVFQFVAHVKLFNPKIACFGKEEIYIATFATVTFLVKNVLKITATFRANKSFLFVKHFSYVNDVGLVTILAMKNIDVATTIAQSAKRLYPLTMNVTCSRINFWMKLHMKRQATTKRRLPRQTLYSSFGSRNQDTSCGTLKRLPSTNKQEKDS